VERQNISVPLPPAQREIPGRDYRIRRPEMGGIQRPGLLLPHVPPQKPASKTKYQARIEIKYLNAR